MQIRLRVHTRTGAVWKGEPANLTWTTWKHEAQIKSSRTAGQDLSQSVVQDGRLRWREGVLKDVLRVRRIQLIHW